jgi:sortase B
MFNNDKDLKKEKASDYKSDRKPLAIDLRVIALIICAGAFLYSAYNLFVIYSEYNKGTKEYENLQKYTNMIPNNNSKSNTDLDIDFNELRSINKDVVGWIYFEDIEINYPIVKGSDDSFYLKHTFKKEENKAGSIFMDFENDGSFKDLHTVIYGHNLKNSSMFSTLMKYKDIEFYKTKPYFYIYTPEGKLKCEIFSCYITNSTDFGYNKEFNSKDEYVKFLKALIDKSIYDTGVAVTEESNIISLSTCTNSDKDSRIIVHAKVLKQ